MGINFYKYRREHTLETKLKMSKSRLGIKTKPCSEERKRKISLANKGKLTGEKNPKFRCDITQEKVRYVIKTIFCNNKDNTLKEFKKLIKEKLSCSEKPIHRVWGKSLSNILKELDVYNGLYKNTWKKMGEKLRGHGSPRWGKHNSEEHNQRIREANMGRKFSKASRKKMSESFKLRIGEKNSHFRFDITREKIKITIEEIISRNKKIVLGDLKEQITKELGCSEVPIRTRWGSISVILQDLGISLPRKQRWQRKEEFGIQLAKEIYGEGDIKRYYKELHSRPDFVPSDTTQPIIDIKSTTQDVKMLQKNKYERIRQNVRFIVFENRGNTEVPSNKIQYMEELIQSLPNTKRRLFKEEYTRIRLGIDEEQKTLSEITIITQ